MMKQQLLSQALGKKWYLSRSLASTSVEEGLKSYKNFWDSVDGDTMLKDKRTVGNQNMRPEDLVLPAVCFLRKEKLK